MLTDPVQHSDVGQCSGYVACGRLPAGGELHESGCLSHRLHLGDQHAKRRPCPIASEPANVTAGRFAQERERLGVAGHEVGDSCILRVDGRRCAER